MTGLAWFLTIGAAWRITLLVVADHVTQPVRDRIEARWTSDEVAYLLACPWCASTWIAPFVVASGLAWSSGWGWQFVAGSLTASVITGWLSTFAAPAG